MAAKKKAAPAPKKAPGKGRGKGRPFQKGHEYGKATRWGQPNGNKPGRPRNEASPRAQLKRLADQPLPDTLREEMAEAYPELSEKELKSLTYAAYIAHRHIQEAAAKGDPRLLAETYKQVDDAGSEKVQHEFEKTAADAAESLTGYLAGLASKLGEGSST